MRTTVVEAPSLGRAIARCQLAGDTCLRLRPGPYEGVTEDPETEIETDVGPRARRRLKATSGRWTIAADGIRKGC